MSTGQILVQENLEGTATKDGPRDSTSQIINNLGPQTNYWNNSTLEGWLNNQILVRKGRILFRQQ
eukprot:4500905-Ditylum_brightwellii.AAC.2